MAVTANQIVKRQGRDGMIRELAVAAGKHIYEGTLVYIANGYATDVISGAANKFGGIARSEADNTGGADGAITLDVWADGDFDLPMDTTSLVAADMPKTLYGTDNFTITETSAAHPEVGMLVKVLSTSLARVAIRGVGQGIATAGT